MNHNHDHVIRTQEEADAFIHDLLSAIGGLQARVRSSSGSVQYSWAA